VFEQLKFIMDRDSATGSLPVKGLYPFYFDTGSLGGSGYSKFGVSGGYDSFYEYELKVWLATKDERYKNMYVESADAIINHIVQHINVGNETMAYAPDVGIHSGQSHPNNNFHHLVLCKRCLIE
jgi:hypothetical protein